MFSPSSSKLATAFTLLFSIFSGVLSSDLSAQNAAPPESTAFPAARLSWQEVGLLLEQQTDQDEPVLIVTGNARVEAEPDRAKIFFAVETEGRTAAEAGEANANRMTAVAAALRAAAGSTPGFRLETSGYSLSPQYGPYREGRNAEIVGYIARNTIHITLDVVDQSGTLIDAALGAGANRVAGLNFELRDPEPYRHEAVRQAILKARGEAEIMAAALGMRLGVPLEVQGGADFYFPPQPYMARAEMMDAQAATPTPVESGLQTVSAQVTIRFRIAPLP